MTKFKIGDRVRVAEYGTAGLTGIILSRTSADTLHVRWGGGEGWYPAKVLELVSETQINSENSLEFMQARVWDLEGTTTRLSDILNLRTKERDAMQACIDKQEQQLQAYEAQLTLQEEGPASLLARLERQTRDLGYLTERSQKAEARVGELQDAFKTQQEYTIEVETECDSLRAQLAELTKPKLIKQTWQRVFPDTGLSESGVGGFHEQLDKLDRWGEIAYIRRDTYRLPDGSTKVEAVLEPVSETNNQ